MADLFLYSYEADFVQHLQEAKKSFNLAFRYIDDILSLNNPKYNDYILMLFIRRNLILKTQQNAPKWANYLDLHLEFDEDGKLLT